MATRPAERLSVVWTSVQAFRRPDVPLLESLDIRNDKSTNSLYMSYSEFAHWNAPSLRHVTAVHYFPLSLPSLTNVTTLDITLILNFQIDFSDMLADLSRMRFLEKLQVEVRQLLRRSRRAQRKSAVQEDGTSEHTSPTNRDRARICARFRLFRLSNASLFSSLFFPGAVDLARETIRRSDQVLPRGGLRHPRFGGRDYANISER